MFCRAQYLGVRVGQLLKTLDSVPVRGSNIAALERSRELEKMEMEFELEQNLPTAVVCYIHDMVAHNPAPLKDPPDAPPPLLWILSSR